MNTLHKSRFERMLEASHEEIYVFDAKTLKFLQVSHGTLTNLGYTAEEMKTKTPCDIKPAFTCEMFEKIMEPLLKGEKKIVYFETLHRRKDGTDYSVDVRLQFIDDEIEPVFMAIVTDITERKKTEDELRRLAFMDTVSSLYNRRYFVDAAERVLSHSQRANQPVGFILIDLDHFSDINNTYGHLVGDELIREMGRRMLRVFSRKEDIVARWGGDEFVILCQDLSYSAFKKKCHQLLKFIREDIYLDHNIVTVTASVGGFFTTGAKSTIKNAQELISIVDSNMYQSKRKGRDRAIITNDCEEIKDNCPLV